MKKILLLISLNIILFFSQFIFAYESKYFETINANADRYFLSIFRTDLIKICALTPGCSVYSLLQKSEKTPLFLLRNKKEDKFNRLNFTSWVGVYNPRQNEYENPYQADLYVLHELYHMVTMKYGNYKNLESWKDKIITNEKEASFYSEGLIYFELPKLRNLVPFKEIWVDKFLNDQVYLIKGISNRDLYNKNPSLFQRLLFDKFISIYYTDPKLLDTLELRTLNYKLLDEVWLDVWKDDYHIVEGEMVEFYNLINKGDLNLAIDKHLKWLDMNTKDFIWFPNNAKKFYIKSKPIIDKIKLDSKASFSKILESYSKDLAKVLRLQNIKIDEYTKAGIDGLKDGYMQAVYSISWPETKETILYESINLDYDKLYSKPYIQTQDIMHKQFIESYKKWINPVVDGIDSFKYAYPTNGSSEAIKYYLAYNIKTLNPKAKIHIFKGEYQGINMISNALGVNVIEHERSKSVIDNLANLVNKGDFFYISQPSGIDGNLWKDYDYFLKKAYEAEIKIMLDLAYVGLVPHKYFIEVNHKAIDVVFFSLSKPMGVYYSRIGGIFLKKESPILFDTIWFKNLFSMHLGVKLMEKYNVFYIAKKYAYTQDIAKSYINNINKTSFEKSDVIILLHSDSKEISKNSKFKYFTRGNGNTATVRLCISPLTDTIILNQQVVLPANSPYDIP